MDQSITVLVADDALGIHVGGSGRGSDPHPEEYDPDLWTDEFAFLARPGGAGLAVRDAAALAGDLRQVISRWTPRRRRSLTGSWLR